MSLLVVNHIKMVNQESPQSKNKSAMSAEQDVICSVDNPKMAPIVNSELIQLLVALAHGQLLQLDPTETASAQYHPHEPPFSS